MLCKCVYFFGLILCKVLFFLRVEGKEKLPRSGGAILCANHRSFWDPILLAASSRRPFAFIAKEELFKNKLFGYILRKLRCYPVRRDGSDLAVVKMALSLLKQGEVVVIFPEGERIRKGKTPHPKAGAFRLAMMAGVPLVPAGIVGNFRIFRPMRVRYGESIDAAQFKGQRLTEEEYTEKIRAVMATIYDLAEEANALD